MKLVTRIFILLCIMIISVSTASAYHYVCLSMDETLASGWLCEHECCANICVDENNYQAAWYHCRGMTPCSCNGGDTPNDFKAPTITLVEPEELRSYPSRSVPFDIALDETAQILDYMEQGEERRGWTRLCPSSCSSYRGSRSFSDGEHNITIRAIDRRGNAGQKEVIFYVDSLAPRIRRTLPARGAYGNGEFSIEYSENNVVNITLYYADGGTPDYKELTKTDCPSGPNEVCEFVVEEELAQGVLNYKFGITDRAQTVFSDVVDIIIDTVVPVLTVTTPQDPIQNFDATRVPLDLETTEPCKISYWDDFDRTPKWRTLCKDCMEYEKTVSFKDGLHLVDFKAVDNAGNEHIIGREFYVDSKAPKIRSTEPKQNKFGNGEFKVEYDEENVEKVYLYYRQNPHEDYTEAYTTHCDPGRRMECVFSVGGIDEGWLEYWFKIKDIASATDESDPTVVIIDTIAPELIVEQPDETVYDSRKVPFSLSANEETTFQYIDYEDHNPKWRRLCTGCDVYERDQTFRDGYHNIEIRAIDEAGNEDKLPWDFIVDSKAPRIRSSEPRHRKFGNGVFSVLYNEQNPVDVILHYAFEEEGDYIAVPGEDCPGGSNEICEVEVPNMPDGTVYYFFSIVDIGGLDSVQRRISEVTIDTEKPGLEVANPTNRIYYDRRMELDIETTEDCLIEYYNHLSDTPRWKTLCARCKEYKRAKYFGYGNYNLTIKATDEAGNIAEHNVEFSIE